MRVKRALERGTCLNLDIKGDFEPHRANSRGSLITDHLEMGTAKVHYQGGQ